MFRGNRIDGLHFDPPNPQNLIFKSLRCEKVNFFVYLDNRESDSHSVFSYNFLQTRGRCELSFVAIELMVCILTPKNLVTVLTVTNQ